jgi:hypothetical protein
MVRVEWRDIYQRDSVKSKWFGDDAIMDKMTTVKPTITYGVLVYIKNGCIVVSQELCTEENDRATMMEVIPVGVIDSIMKLVPAYCMQKRREKLRHQKKSMVKKEKTHQ